MLKSFNAWVESMRFAWEVQGVVAMRLVRLAQGGAQADAEAQLMIAEKSRPSPTPKSPSPRRWPRAKIS